MLVGTYSGTQFGALSSGLSMSEDEGKEGFHIDTWYFLDLRKGTGETEKDEKTYKRNLPPVR